MACWLCCARSARSGPLACSCSRTVEIGVASIDSRRSEFDGDQTKPFGVRQLMEQICRLRMRPTTTTTPDSTAASSPIES